MGFRERRQEHRDERRGGNGATHYRMRQRLVSIGDDYWIEDGEGRRVFKVDGKALRIRQTMNFDNTDGNTLLRIQHKAAHDQLRCGQSLGGVVAGEVRCGVAASG